MKAVLQQQQPASIYRPVNHSFSIANLWNRFIAFADGQEKNRMLWAAIGLTGHGTFFTIATMATVILTGNVFALLAAACFPMVLVVIVNLAALPTKYTIPVFFLSLLADLVIIATALALWLN